MAVRRLIASLPAHSQLTDNDINKTQMKNNEENDKTLLVATSRLMMDQEVKRNATRQRTRWRVPSRSWKRPFIGSIKQTTRTFPYTPSFLRPYHNVNYK